MAYHGDSTNVITYIYAAKNMILITAKEVFGKIQHPSKIRTLNKVRIEGAFINLLKIIYWKIIASFVHNIERPNAFL